MEILCTELFQKQLTNILETFSNIDLAATQKFKSYLDTIIINIPTKASKYKQSQYFNDKDIREVIHENFIIFFYVKEDTQTYLILSIVEKN